MADPLTHDEIRALRWVPSLSPKASGRWVVTNQVRHRGAWLAIHGWRLSRRDRGDLLERRVGPLVLTVRPASELATGTWGVSWSVSPGWWEPGSLGGIGGVIRSHPNTATIDGVLACEAAVIRLAEKIMKEVPHA